MSLMTALGLLAGMIDGVERGPEPEDVKAGWVAFAVFLLLCAALAFLGFSLVKQLRRAQAAKDAGVYGDAPVAGAGVEPDGGIDRGSDRDIDRGVDGGPGDGADPEAPHDHPEQSRG